jgi:hypothetical protein
VQDPSLTARSGHEHMFASAGDACRLPASSSVRCADRIVVGRG